MNIIESECKSLKQALADWKLADLKTQISPGFGQRIVPEQWLIHSSRTLELFSLKSSN